MNQSSSAVVVDTFRMEACRVFTAPASEIFAILTDPEGHVAIDSSGMLQGSSGSIVDEVGNSFVVHMDRESLGDYDLGRYDVTVSITKFRRDELIEWTVFGQIKPPIGHVYGYQLTPVANGTQVRSYYDWSNADGQWRESGLLPVIGVQALRASLGILEREVTRRRSR